MPEPLPSRLARARHRLRTFGTLALLEPDDSIPADRGPQRRLALLAVLAAAGQRGRSRDELFLLFWPEATQARARHSLEQLLYSVRTSLDKDVFAGVNPVRLNPEALSSDVGDFTEAVSRGDHAAAVGCYQGPFLEGFYLSDAPEFEQWTAIERAQLERRYAESLERLATQSDAESDHVSAARWWRTLADTHPMSDRSAAGLIRALMAAGDHTAALQHAERHEAAVMQTLGAGVGTGVAELVATLRDRSNARRIEGAADAPTAAIPTLRVPAPVVPTRDTSAEPARPIRHFAIRRFLPYLAAVVLLAVVAGVWLRPRQPDVAPSASTERSIAVLPFKNLSRTPQDSAIVNGITEAMIAVLSRIDGLRVIARTSAFAFRNTDLDVRRIADSLGVSHVLEGSVQRDAAKLRIQVFLVDARDGSTSWSETYDRQASDIFAVQSDIAGRVAGELALRMSEGARVRVKRGLTTSIPAYELYLRAIDPSMLRSDSAARTALGYLEEAIAMDPQFAAAHAALSRLRLRARSAPQQSAQSRKALLVAAEESARRAIALDDSLAEAHAALSILMRNLYKLDVAEAEMRRAVALEPANARFREWLGQILISTERPAEALVEARRALRLDPLAPTARAEVANALLANDRCDEALAQLEGVMQVQPPLLRALGISAQCHARKKMWPEAIADAQRLSATAGERGQTLHGYILARSGRVQEARQVLEVLLARAARTDGAFEVAVVYVGLGESDQAFLWLDRAIDDESLQFYWMQSALQEMQHDPRFDRIRQRLGYQKR